MRDLNQTLKQLCDRNRDGNRYLNAMLLAEQKKEALRLAA